MIKLQIPTAKLNNQVKIFTIYLQYLLPTWIFIHNLFTHSKTVAIASGQTHENLFIPKIDLEKIF